MTQFTVELGNPQAGLKISLVLDRAMDSEQAEVLVEEALDRLKLAGERWKQWSLENETGEEREVRLLVEKNRVLQKQALERQNLELEQLLAGSDEGIGRVGRGA